MLESNKPAFVGVTLAALKVLPGDTIGGLLKLKTEEPPGPVGVAGRGPGEASRENKS